MSLPSFPPGFRALVIGASGAIGAAFVARLAADPACGTVLGLHRHSPPAIDFDIDGSVAAAAAQLAGQVPFHRVINAAGLLHGAQSLRVFRAQPSSAPERRPVQAEPGHKQS